MSANKHIGQENTDRRLRELFGKDMPYETPEGYFDELPGRIMSSVRKEAGRKRRSIVMMTRYSVAAAITVLAAISILLVMMNRQQQGVEEPLTYSVHDVYMTGIDNLSDLEESYLLTMVDEDSLDLGELMSADAGDLEEETIINYLLADNHIEYYFIEEY